MKLLALLGSLLALPLMAAPPYLVKNINENVSPSSSHPDHFAKLGSLVFFSTTDFNGYPQELWRTDGTEAGTFYLAPRGQSKVVWNGKLWFIGADAGPSFWSTDGTVAGTQKLTLPAPSPGPFALMAGTTHLYYFTSDGLWQTDGTTGGTSKISSTVFALTYVRNDYSPLSAIAGSTVFFLANTDAAGYELWRVDGAVASMVMPLSATFEHTHTPMSAGNLFYFQITSTSPHGGVTGTALWRSDGTPAGTFPLTSPSAQPLNLGFVPANVLVSGSTVYFTANDGSGMKLWQSDGTAAGTLALASTLPGSAATDFAATPLARLANGTMLFRGPRVNDPGAAFGYWAYDGTNTTFLANAYGNGNWSLKAAVGGDYAVFGFSERLWRSDGTVGGTYTLGQFFGNDGYHDWPMIDLGTNVIFGAIGSPHGAELWKTDGSIPNTRLLKDINATTFASTPKMMRAFKGGVLFTASGDALDDWSFAGTRDLWFSDGTEAGTQKLLPNANIYAGVQPCGGRTFFDSSNEVTGSELWITDGTPGGTVMLKDIFPGSANNGVAHSSSPRSFTCVDDILFFYASSSSGGGVELWRSDGTVNGTLKIREVATNQRPYTRPFRFGHQLFFSVDRQLWRSDGTAGGTVMVKEVTDVWPINEGSVVSGPYFYFTTLESGLGSVLWRSDGTEAGTVRFLSAPYLTPYSDFYGRLAFTMSGQFTTEHGLCTTDGTEAGTTCFDPQLSGSGGWDFNMWPFNGRLYYNKPNLRSTDGTTFVESGVEDVDTFLTNAGGRLFFTGNVSAYSGMLGVLLETDGTLAGTTTLLSRGTREAVGSGGRLFIAADELYAYDLEVTPTSFAPRAVATPGGETVTITGRGFVGPVSITVGNSPAVVGAVTPTSITFTAPVNETGAYDVKLILGDGRYITLDEQLLYTCAPPTAAVGPNPAAVCPMTPVQLQGSGGTQCHWFPATGLDNPSSCTPTATVSATTTYTLIVSDNGCESTNHPTVTVTVNPNPNPNITIVGVGETLTPNTTYTAQVADAGAGATYAWTVTNATLTSDPSQRTITFRTGCIAVKLAVSITNAAGCNATSTKDGWVGNFAASSFSPRLAHPGATITIKGTHLECFATVKLVHPSSWSLFRELPVTHVDDDTLQFRYPVDAPFRLELMPHPSPFGQFPIGSNTGSSILTRAAHRDLSGNASADVFWRNGATGDTQVWRLTGTSVFSNFSWTAPTSWVPQVMGDFDGDGVSDIFWRNSSTGQTSIWFMFNGTVKSAAALLTIPLDWKPVGTGDFDFDGKYDIFWTNSVTGETSIWFMNGSSFNGVRSWTVPTSWQPVAFGDFNADGMTDIFWRSPSTGETSIWLMNGTLPSTAVRGDTVDPNWVVAGTGRFNGDARMDLFWRNTVTGQNSMWFMNGTSYTGSLTESVPLGWWPVSFGEFNANGVTHDVFWHNASTGETSIWLMNSANPAIPSSAVRATTLDPNWRVLTSP